MKNYYLLIILLIFFSCEKKKEEQTTAEAEPRVVLVSPAGKKYYEPAWPAVTKNKLDRIS